MYYLYKRRQPKMKVKTCQYEGCGKEFIGHSVCKYCEFHRDVKNRKKRAKKKHVNENRIINHTNEGITPQELECGLDGCKNKYPVLLIPKQTVYPNFCPEHRNKFKRKMFLRGQTDD